LREINNCWGQEKGATWLKRRISLGGKNDRGKWTRTRAKKKSGGLELFDKRGMTKNCLRKPPAVGGGASSTPG